MNECTVYPRMATAPHYFQCSERPRPPRHVLILVERDRVKTTISIILPYGRYKHSPINPDDGFLDKITLDRHFK